MCPKTLEIFPKSKMASCLVEILRHTHDLPCGHLGPEGCCAPSLKSVKWLPSCITDWPLPLLSFFFSENVLQALKCLKLEELVGEVQEEEEPEGEHTAEPSGVAGEQSSDYVLCVFFSTSNHLFLRKTFQIISSITLLVSVWILIWKHPAILLPYVLACLTCRWVRQGRGVQGRDEWGAGVGGG